MKKYLLTFVILALSVSAFAQEELTRDQKYPGQIKFMGVTIDGPKEEMVTQLKAKGFYGNSSELRGEFNGRTVSVYVVTNHGNAYRVYVEYPLCSARQIISEYNKLLRQFTLNDKYVGFSANESIPESTNIAYEMGVNNKTYEAAFIYISPDLFPEDEVSALRRLTADEILLKELSSPFDSMPNTGDFLKDIAASIEKTSKSMSLTSGRVWFKINQEGSKYHIGLYYDNIYHMPNGEDL